MSQSGQVAVYKPLAATESLELIMKPLIVDDVTVPLNSFGPKRSLSGTDSLANPKKQKVDDYELYQTANIFLIQIIKSSMGQILHHY